MQLKNDAAGPCVVVTPSSSASVSTCPRLVIPKTYLACSITPKYNLILLCHLSCDCNSHLIPCCQYYQAGRWFGHAVWIQDYSLLFSNLGFVKDNEIFDCPFSIKVSEQQKVTLHTADWRECLANVQLRMFTVVICISCVGQHKATEHIRALRLRGMMFVFCRFSKGS